MTSLSACDVFAMPPAVTRVTSSPPARQGDVRSAAADAQEADRRPWANPEESLSSAVRMKDFSTVCLFNRHIFSALTLSVTSQEL